jgi:hypothetical protein
MYYCWKKDKSIRPSQFYNYSHGEMLVIKAFIEQEIEESR